MKKMTGHPRLFRRGARYYHRAAIPVDIKDSYEKTEETFSLKTADYQEAVRRVRVEAVRVDRLFEAHRRKLKTEAEPLLRELPIDQIRAIGQIYYAYLLEEDEESRVFDGFGQNDKTTIQISETDDVGEVFAKYGFRRPSFEQAEQEHADNLADDRKDYAKGYISDFFEGEVEEVLSWENINLRLIVEYALFH